jgi:hypothetical protein
MVAEVLIVTLQQQEEYIYIYIYIYTYFVRGISVTISIMKHCVCEYVSEISNQVYCS